MGKLHITPADKPSDIDYIEMSAAHWWLERREKWSGDRWYDPVQRAKVVNLLSSYREYVLSNAYIQNTDAVRRYANHIRLLENRLGVGRPQTLPAPELPPDVEVLFGQTVGAWGRFRYRIRFKVRAKVIRARIRLSHIYAQAAEFYNTYTRFVSLAYKVHKRHDTNAHRLNFIMDLQRLPFHKQERIRALIRRRNFRGVAR